MLVWIPAIAGFGGTNFLLAERFTVRGGGILFVRRAIGNMAIHNDQRGAFVFFERRRKGLLQLLKIIGIANALHIPVIPHKARRHVFSERQRRVALNGNAVIVIDPDQIAEAQVPGQRRRLAGDAFHHAAIAAQRHNVMRDDLMPGPIVVRPQPAARKRHADTGRHPLPEWPGSRLNPRGQRVVRGVFGMSRAFAVHLTEVHDIVEWQIEAIHMQGTIEQDGGMPAR